MQLHNLIKEALKEKAPELHRSLAAKGELNQYAANLASEISSETVQLTQRQRIKENWDRLGTVECAAKMKMAEALNREAVLAAALEFPQGETSPQSQD